MMSETLAICEHGVPRKFKTCLDCYFDKEREECAHQFKIDYILHNLDELKKQFKHYESIMIRLSRIEREAEAAIDLLVKKAHELKQIDAKRDDVINLLNQKITALEQKRS